MSKDQAFLLDQFHRYKKEGMEAYRQKKWQEARELLLKAAEYLFKLAKGSGGQLRESRKINAKKLKEMALKIEGTSQKDSPSSQFLIKDRPKTRFGDIAGLDDIKETIRIKMVYPFSHPELAERYNIKGGGGILLYGPPGTGKTLIARAVAGEIDAAFFTVKPSDIMSKLVGEAEKNVASLFCEARKENRAVIFIDEIEALVPSRRDDGSAVMQRVVPQILQEMEGISTDKSHPLLFIGATNEPWGLDPAIMRPGRFDELLYIGLPNKDARKEIFRINLDKKPLDPEIDLNILADKTDGYSGADIAGICRQATSLAFLEAIQNEKEEPISFKHLNDAMTSRSPSVTQEQLLRFEEFKKRE